MFTSRDIQQLCKYCTLFVYKMYFRMHSFCIYCIYMYITDVLPNKYKLRSVWAINMQRDILTRGRSVLIQRHGFYCIFILVTSPPIGGGRGIVMPMSVCLFVCLFVCVFVCPCFRKISKCNISAISQPIIMKLITYGYTVTDKYFQNFRSKVKVVGRRKVKNVIWPYLGNEWS